MCILGGGDGALPRVIRAYVNQEALDFSDAEGITPEQEFEITDAPDPEGTREYPMLFSRFQSVTKLSLLISENHGADATRIYYIGLKGVPPPYPTPPPPYPPPPTPSLPFSPHPPRPPYLSPPNPPPIHPAHPTFPLLTPRPNPPHPPHPLFQRCGHAVQ